MGETRETDINKIDFDKAKPEDLNFLVLENLKYIYIDEKSEIMDNILFIPEYSLSIRPNVVKLNNNLAVIDYFLYSPDWDREIYECSTSFGENKKNALSMAEGGFSFGLMSGVKFMQEKESFKTVETEFNGPHIWKLYSSNIVGMGEIPDTENPEELWTIIKDEIIKYLGNQKLVYVKVFAGRTNGEAMGECRINDEPIEELGDMIAEYVAGWDTKNFGTKKQFFFAVQEDSTYTPYPYTNEDIEKYVLLTANMFEKCKTEDDLHEMGMKLIDITGDKSLTEELMNFIPEICAERGFQKIIYPEKIEICIGDEEPKEYYKSQIYSYHIIKRAVNHLIDHGHILKDLFLKFIGISSIYNVICETKEKKGIDLPTKEGAMIKSMYGFSAEYKMR